MRARTSGTSRIRRLVPAIILVVIAALGGAVVAYPSASVWFSNLGHQGTIAKYSHSVSSMTDRQRAAGLAAAHRYNAKLPAGPVRDPYSRSAAEPGVSAAAKVKRYNSLLSAEPDEPMGRLRIPSIGVDLPIYHGTSDTTLARGVGHLFGTSLPVGGPGTHAVLTTHSGWLRATLFNDLDRVKKGETFTISVLGETLTYRVDRISTVLPTNLKQLGRVSGKDYVTLVTCTPTGVNTHRLLVRGIRVATTNDSHAVSGKLDSSDRAGFPWWILAGVLPPVVVWFLVRPRRGRHTGGRGRGRAERAS